MELGEKLFKARQEAGLSQRQLCGDMITRNMLSQIEHGTARPSMQTLQYLASRLGKSVAYFLEEEETFSPNQKLMAHARRAYKSGAWEEARTVLAGFCQPDEVFDLEYCFLYAMTTLEAAEKAIAGNKYIYAEELLQDLQPMTDMLPGLEHRRLLLLGRIPGHDLGTLCEKLPGLDEELFLRARAAEEDRHWDRGIALLEAMEDRNGTDWHLLRAKLCMGKGDYSEATRHLHCVERECPERTAPLLETCYRELGHYKKAYQYACKQREKK